MLTRAEAEAKGLRDILTVEDAWDAALKLTVEERLDQGTVNPHRPGLDDGPPARAWATMAEYKAFCNTLPRWMGYHQADDDEATRSQPME